MGPSFPRAVMKHSLSSLPFTSYTWISYNTGRGKCKPPWIKPLCGLILTLSDRGVDSFSSEVADLLLSFPAGGIECDLTYLTYSTFSGRAVLSSTASHRNDKTKNAHVVLHKERLNVWTCSFSGEGVLGLPHFLPSYSFRESVCALLQTGLIFFLTHRIYLLLHCPTHPSTSPCLHLCILTAVGNHSSL